MMGQIEDIYLEVYDKIENLDLKKEFDEEIKVMWESGKFKNMEPHRKWERACEKVIKDKKKQR